MSNETARPVGRELLLPHVLGRRAVENPERVFLQEVTGRSATYGEFHESALTWADALRRLGVAREETVATMLPPSIDAHSVWLGLAWLNAVEVPLNTDYRGSMLSYALTDCGARVVVTRAELLDRLDEVASSLPALEIVVILDADSPRRDFPFRVVAGEELLSAARPATDLHGPQFWDLACIIYTSGTTGPSKGVMLPWPLLHLQAARTFPFDDLNADDVFYAPYPVFHLSGKFPPYLMALLNARLLVRERFSVTDFWSDISTYGCTTTIVGGALTSFIYGQDRRPDDAETPLHNVVMAPVIPEFEDFCSRFGTRICTAYAMTELGPVLGHDFGEITLENHQSCGRVKKGYPGYEVRVVDEHDVEVPAGVVGELIVRSSAPWTLNAGYLGKPRDSAKAWMNGWFHTGDAFTYDERGQLYFVDRTKDTIRRRGENISSFEVEALVSEHPDILQCAAIAVPSELGEDEVKVVVVLKPGRHLGPEELLEFLVPRMPRFMVPRYLEFVDDLPKTETQKVRKVEFREDALNERTWDREKAGIEVPR